MGAGGAKVGVMRVHAPGGGCVSWARWGGCEGVVRMGTGCCEQLFLRRGLLALGERSGVRRSTAVCGSSAAGVCAAAMHVPVTLGE